MITSAAKRQNGGLTPVPKKDPTTCLVQGCDTVVPPHVRLCRLHYHECVAGKQANLPLRTGGTAHFDLQTNRIVYPVSTPGPGKTKSTPTKKVSIKVGVVLGSQLALTDLVVQPPVVSESPSTIACLSSTPSSLSVVFYVDSGAGQSLCCCEDAFISIRSCAIEVVGVSGSLPIHGVGTAAFAATDDTGQFVTILIHNCLLSPGGSFNLLSVSQLQHSRVNTVDFDPEFPHLRLQSITGYCHIPLVMTDGLYSVIMSPLSVNDTRYLDQPLFALTDKGRYSPPTTPAVVPNSSPEISTFGTWVCRMIVAPSSRRRVLAFPTVDGPAFGTHLRDFCQQFLAPPSIPPARRSYDVDNPTHMSDLSVRFMGTSHDKLQRTVELNRGLGPTTGRVPTLNFPQGKFRQGKTPKVSKDKVHHLQRASICEVVFTDTFDTGDHRFRYGQAFVDYRSRWGDVIPMSSRTQVRWAFSEFICRNFIPLIIVRDNIAENRGGALMEECRRHGVQSAFICPYTPQQDQAENYLGCVTAMASYAMIYSGAPLFFWPWAIMAAVFICNITATYYSREHV